ncbi:hypothetical protein [Ancylobacter mangrovi]|uniref:hypothetical protein n=1 Tax=Ancylobacter mangrovi TaxID=2972472 RepID=UPI002163425E|nr:hypothetical protein [Ancylobacter mangrovi]MCS0501415.1 hypothetical protein [Ancylobacter mangrovi]
MDCTIPAFHQAALASFFSRHDIPVRFAGHLPLFQRLGLAVLLAGALRGAGFRSGAGAAGGLEVGGILFPRDDWHAGMDAAARLAGTWRALEEGGAPGPGTPVDRMALIMRRLEGAGIPVTPEVIVGEGFTMAEALEWGLPAAQLAEAMKLAAHHYRRARIDGGAHAREAA